MTRTQPKKRPRPRRPSKAERAAAERRRAQRQRLGFGLVAVAVVAVIAVVATTGGNEDGTSVGPSASGEVEIAAGPRSTPLGIGEPVPDFSAPGLRGGRVAWSDVAGQPVVLAVWAPWCPHCQVELPVLGRVARDHPDVRVMTIVSTIGQSPGPDPLAFMVDNGLTFPTAVDDEATTLLQGLGVQGFPTAYFVGSDGVVRQVTSGETDETTLQRLFEGLS